MVGDLLHLGCVCKWKEFIFWEHVGLITVTCVDKGLFDHVGSGIPIHAGVWNIGIIDQGWREYAR